ncbi:aldolase/citrate lyase family protein [Enterovirga rhinocerotis]|uniref:2,4-dihydroxyhept-2-enedioate aldolase n=1 Tax=Enterovirga rhinocerotis TaxID=1339210 RepID=A0A4R7C9J0_9HYPH|nr:aldolase/citrate lyase family protein [Enterovirga rhinocerotis]TDR94712.1 2,4-dihydroxyhept-2-enedioate aldolase [Enterovirga rhinocerotis]
MEIKRNAFKAAILRGERQIGLWSSLCSPIVAEIIGGAGFDWILIDTEHSPNEVPDVVAQLQALATSTATPIVRPAWNDPVLIKRFLDAGAQSLLLPFVQNEAEAKAAVAATRYPPHGIRGITTSGRAGGYGRIKDYLHKAPAEICVLVQVETREALDDLEAIARVDGVDGVFIGPADLSASLGHLGDQAHPVVQDAIRDAIGRLKAVGKPAGILTGNEEQARRYIEWGATFTAVGADLGLLARNAEALAARFKTV